MSTTPALSPQPQKKSNALWWVLGVLVVAVLVFSIGGMMIARFFLKDVVEVRQASGQVEIQAPGVSVKVDKSAPPDTGLPLYPGATVAETGGTVEIGSPADETVRVVAARYRTQDSIDTVDDWYRQQLGPEFRREGPGEMIRKKEVFGISVKSSDIAFISESNDLLRVVVLERKGLHTEIGLAKIGKQETQ
jgi:hypothetical protein